MALRGSRPNVRSIREHQTFLPSSEFPRMTPSGPSRFSTREWLTTTISILNEDIPFGGPIDHRQKILPRASRNVPRGHGLRGAVAAPTIAPPAAPTAAPARAPLVRPDAAPPTAAPASPPMTAPPAARSPEVLHAAMENVSAPAAMTIMIFLIGPSFRATESRPAVLPGQGRVSPIAACVAIRGNPGFRRGKNPD